MELQFVSLFYRNVKHQEVLWNYSLFHCFAGMWSIRRNCGTIVCFIVLQEREGSGGAMELQSGET